MRWIAATLMGLLALAYALIVFAAPGTKVRPAPDDQGFGGLALFAKALRDAGYRVALDPSSKPRLARGDVAIVPVMRTQGQAFETPAAVVGYAKRGGRALVLSVPAELQPIDETVSARNAAGRRAKVDSTFAEPLPKAPGEQGAATDWSGDYGPISSLTQVGQGRIARLEEGALATNRFLGRVDNAKVVLATVATVAARGDRLVFLAMGYGEAEDLGPLEAIGPWAVGAVWQSLAVLAAFGLARGVRFGLPAPEARHRRGAREPLDAVAGHYGRGRHTDAPLAAAARERPDDVAVQALAARPKVSEEEARRALAELESRPKPRR